MQEQDSPIHQKTIEERIIELNISDNSKSSEAFRVYSMEFNAETG